MFTFICSLNTQIELTISHAVHCFVREAFGVRNDITSNTTALLLAVYMRLMLVAHTCACEVIHV